MTNQPLRVLYLPFFRFANNSAVCAVTQIALFMAELGCISLILISLLNLRKKTLSGLLLVCHHTPDLRKKLQEMRKAVLIYGEKVVDSCHLIPMGLLSCSSYSATLK